MSLRLQYRRYRLPFRTTVRTAHGVWAEREGIFIRLEDEAGGVGFGECAPLPDFGTETVDDAEEACRTLGEIVNEQDLATLPVHLSCLCHAVEGALKQLRLKSADGGAGADGGSEAALAVAALLPAGKDSLTQAGPKADLGFRVFKWKVGVGDPADELTLLDDLCAELPTGTKLRLDANGAWDRRRAERWLSVCAERPVEFVEQPISPQLRGAEDLLLGLAYDYPTPIALDESLGSDGDVESWLQRGWPGVFVVKPSLHRELSHTLEKLAARQAKVVFSSALETALGARRALETAFTWRGPRAAVGFGVWPLFQDQRFDGPMTGPFLRRADLQLIDEDALWRAAGDFST